MRLYFQTGCACDRVDTQLRDNRLGSLRTDADLRTHIYAAQPVDDADHEAVRTALGARGLNVEGSPAKPSAREREHRLT